ncbi:MAG: antitoxin [Persephonella sp.]|nr:MAG: antitoxin [Persephonella sp.]RUM61105.1 MAG: antitoxin [Persephonella sp.]
MCEYNKDIVIDILNQIKQSIDLIIERASTIKTADGFVNSKEGLEKLDAICMRLLTIGESLKQIDKITNKTLLKMYPEIEWDKAKRIRDIIAHHYFDIDEEIVFLICKEKLPEMQKVINKMLNDLKL